MNYRPLLNSELEKFQDALPKYSLCQTLVAILNDSRKGEWTKEDLLSITDEELYKHTLTALRREDQETPETLFTNNNTLEKELERIKQETKEHE